MNAEGGQVWKKLTKKDLILGPRVAADTHSQEVQEMINDLKSKLDDTYTLFELRTLINPTTFEPIIKIVLTKTEKK